MTLNYGIFDVSDPQNPDRVYSAALLSRILSKHIRDGIVHGDGDEMAVTVTDPPALTVRVGTGTAMVQGRFCENDAALTLSVPAAHATYPRIDRVVVRLNASPGRTIDIVVKPGTPAPEPAAPALTRTPEIWELSLAQIRVEAGATSILSAKITDERWDASLCGVAAPAYVPSSQLEVVGAVNMQGKALTGLPVPNAATDAARKGYVDAEIAGKIGGFGISQIAIDADKNWNGKSITNVGIITGRGLQATQKKSYAVSDTVIHTVPGEKSVQSTSPQITHTATVPQGYMTSKFRVKFDGRSYNGAARLLRNGRQEGEVKGYYNNSSWVTYSFDLDDVEPGTVFQVQVWAIDYGYTAYTRDLRICGEVETYIRTIGSPDVTW